ncbi:aminotransferase class I/II-fold pyridoxal phosphate-dependent enzyme [Janibacter melonis]|uniref:Aminotransferase class I/II-fold pyridoxal phosphate-dependent enzyme n=1 Tax=Janibacter melonis TaxID=262209 RepID=A0A5P8FPK6_9MICO|nr:DegT/DnrJ/EryC1/StrS aminotransferase family protein [Janibacter melonis]QFQ30672.1 aminotransferase class I/II-fold pyridoxal phosphate-dependent enzyme [Janibacter melonis]
MSERIYLSKAHVTEVEEGFVLDAVRSGWVAPLGPHVDAFEAEIAERAGVEHALALSSGTAALHLALLHLGARPGSVVLCASMTFAATANAIAYTGAEPVFVDSRDSDGNVDADLMLKAADDLAREGREVVAACSVDLFGRACDYPTLEAGLADRGIPLVEDAAESLGASFAGRPAGSFGRAAVLSFNGNKIMTTSGGGMLVSDDADLIAHARKLSTQAREPVPWYEHTEIGYNYRLSNVLAALGRGQLSRLDEMISRRREIRSTYVAGLGDLEGVRFLFDDDARYVDNCWLTTLVVDRHDVSADMMVAAMDREQIEARHLWKPMHLQPVHSTSRIFDEGVSSRLFAQGLTLPSGSALTDAEIERVITTLRGVLS